MIIINSLNKKSSRLSTHICFLTQLHVAVLTHTELQAGFDRRTIRGNFQVGELKQLLDCVICRYVAQILDTKPSRLARSSIETFINILRIQKCTLMMK